MTDLLFEWNPQKSAGNLRKHRVSFTEAKTVFDDPLSSTLNDDQHSEDEKRLITVGTSSKRRLLFVVYTESTSGIRIIGARLATATERHSRKKSAEKDPLAPRPNLDFSKGARGKYANLLKQGTNLVILDQP